MLERMWVKRNPEGSEMCLSVGETDHHTWAQMANTMRGWLGSGARLCPPWGGTVQLAGVLRAKWRQLAHMWGPAM
jgi:hypothetical protein